MPLDVSHLIRRTTCSDPDHPGEHWVWEGDQDPNTGSPLFYYQGKTHSVKRLLWEHNRKASMPRNRRSWVACGERFCVNPDHLRVTPSTPDIRSRVEETVEGHWRWKGSFHAGKPRVRSRGKEQHPRRVAWEAKHGKILGGQKVLGDCDFPDCINPDHARVRV